MLLSEDGSPGRKDWIDNRLKELDRIFAISVGGFSIMGVPGLFSRDATNPLRFSMRKR